MIISALRFCLIHASVAVALPVGRGHTLDPVVGVLVGAVPCRREQRVQHRRVHRGPVGCDLDWPNSCGADGLLEEPVGSVSVSSGGDEHVDQLAELIDRAVHVAPFSGDLHVGLVDLPAVTEGMPAGPGSLGQQRREAQHPPVDSDVVDLDPALGKQLLDSSIREAET